MADQELAVCIASAQGAGVAIDAEDGRRHRIAILPDDEAPGTLALGACGRDSPLAADRGNLLRRRPHGRRTGRLERVRRATSAAIVFPLEPVARQRCLETGPVLVEPEIDRTVLEGAWRGGHLDVAVKEVAAIAAACCDDFELERDLDRVVRHSDHRVPLANRCGALCERGRAQGQQRDRGERE